MPPAPCQAKTQPGRSCPRDDRIVSLGLHHTIDTAIAHDVIIDAWWTSL